VCRELSRAVRDLLVLSVDPSRIDDPEIAGEPERDRLKKLSGRFSREDLLRAFDVLTKAESDIRTAAQPRHHLEMALLRWIYLRKITPIEDLIAGAGTTPGGAALKPAPRPAAAPAPPSRSQSPVSPRSTTEARERPASSAGPESAALSGTARGKDAFLAEIRKNKVVFYNTVVAQAQTIELAGDRLTFTFLANQRTLRDQFDEKRSWLESIAEQATGRKLTVTATSVPATASSTDGKPKDAVEVPDRKSALREQAMADAGVQAMLEVFPGEIRDVEEM
jgi:DNA polymerase III gamma/tau subunit